MLNNLFNHELYIFQDFSQRNLEVEEILFEGKWLYKLLNERPNYSNKQMFNIIEDKKIKNKKIITLTRKLLD